MDIGLDRITIRKNSILSSDYTTNVVRIHHMYIIYSLLFSGKEGTKK